jgi:hypothetical protein
MKISILLFVDKYWFTTQDDYFCLLTIFIQLQLSLPYEKEREREEKENREH